MAIAIYMIGFIVAMVLCVKVVEEDGGMDFGDLLIAFSISLFSWITVLALWIGGNIKYAEDHRKDDGNNLN